jgi:hypothetical protein
MSDTVTNSLIGGAVTLILGAMNLYAIRLGHKTRDTVAKLENNTNGMQATIERLAGQKGFQEGGDQARKDARDIEEHNK